VESWLPEDTTGRPTARRYSDEEKAEAVRLVRQLRAETDECHGAVKRVAQQFGHGLESVRNWVNQADVDDGTRAGTSSVGAARIRALEQENRGAAPRQRHSAGGVGNLRGGARPPPEAV
jgi:transposase